MCIRTMSPSELIDWGDPQTAELADRELYDGPCGAKCEGNHIVTMTEPGRLRTRRGSHDRSAAPRDRTEAFRRAGYQTTPESIPARWPAPSVLNPVLSPARKAGR
jgi:hypothetical protein